MDGVGCEHSSQAILQGRGNQEGAARQRASSQSGQTACALGDRLTVRVGAAPPDVDEEPEWQDEMRVCESARQDLTLFRVRMPLLEPQHEDGRVDHA
jgi:hypothetical protein